MTTADGLIAATAIADDLTIVTRTLDSMERHDDAAACRAEAERIRTSGK